jgi:hypothetical protein
MRPPRPLVCQCGDCSRPVVRGQTFCGFHKQNGCPIKSPLSGSEPDYVPEEYNNDKAVQYSHNCLSYAMNVHDQTKIKACRDENKCGFHVPGKKMGHPDFSNRMRKTCGDVIARTMADVPNAYLIDFSSQCKPGFSKIATVVDEENDFHYYRQDSNGWWSHKPGGRAVTNKDAVGASIYNPQRASRYYKAEYKGDNELNYDQACPFMCVPRDGSIQLTGGKRHAKK